MKKKKHPLLNEFTVVGAFVAVAAFGLLAGLLALLSNGEVEIPPVSRPAVTAPSVADYRSEAATAFVPFAEQALALGGLDAGPEPRADLASMAETVQERLMRMRVPGSEREAHLSMVLVLDQWKRALGTEDSDISGVIERTQSVLDGHPWLMAP